MRTLMTYSGMHSRITTFQYNREDINWKSSAVSFIQGDLLLASWFLWRNSSGLTECQKKLKQSLDMREIPAFSHVHDENVAVLSGWHFGRLRQESLLMMKVKYFRINWSALKMMHVWNKEVCLFVCLYGWGKLLFVTLGLDTSSCIRLRQEF